MKKTVRLVKVAPGHGAKYWDDCREGGYICVGWDDVGDLRRFASKDEFVDHFKKVIHWYDNSPGTTMRKANELWTLMELNPGDKVVTNRGIKEVLAVGTVRAPGYSWDERRRRYRHTVRIRWDTSYAKQIPPQEAWRHSTVTEVPVKLYRLITGKLPPRGYRVVTGENYRDVRKWVLGPVEQRPHQSEFRDRLIKAYSGCCAISDCDAPQALEAAHIYPTSGPEGNHPSNGILLRRDLHWLFDHFLLAIDHETLRVVIASALKQTVYGRLNGRRLRMPVDPRWCPSRENLRRRRAL
jgi:hypothetical protein